MLQASIPAFFDELRKIAASADGDLMNPAVVSDSAIVDGPPASPFTRRKGYRKLEHVGPVKEAGIKNIARKVLGKGKVVGKKAVDAGNYLTGTMYHRSPKIVRRTIDDMAADPGGYGSVASSAGSLTALLTGGRG